MPTPRVPGRLGRLPGSVPVGLHDLTYYRAGALPKPPLTLDAPEVEEWGMDGNDKYGDCGVAGLNHGFMADAAITEEHEGFPTDEDIVSYYLTYTHGQDSGVELNQFLAYVRAKGFFGHRVEAYAPVAPHDIPTVQFATWAYGFAYSGIVVTEGMQEAFADGEPWDTSVLQSPVLGGHCVPVVAYDDHFLTIVTWGKLQSITYPVWHQIASESWAVITSEFMARDGDGRGISLSALRADLNQLGA